MAILSSLIIIAVIITQVVVVVTVDYFASITIITIFKIMTAFDYWTSLHRRRNLW